MDIKWGVWPDFLFLVDDGKDVAGVNLVERHVGFMSPPIPIPAELTDVEEIKAWVLTLYRMGG